MAEPYLQRIAEDTEIDSPAWTDFDLVRFSKQKSLWDYQETALRNASRALFLYYERFRDYEPGEQNRIAARNFGSTSKPLNPNDTRRSEMMKYYADRGLQEDLDYSRLSVKDSDLLAAYFDVKDKKLKFKELTNRMSFWMATGSGKTLVIVKLIQMLATLIERNEIPKNDILFLAHREDLVEQFREHVREFNETNFGIFVRLHDLKDYSNVKRSNPGLFNGDELNVFTYRSDLFGLEQKDKQIDFRNYDNGGNWYLLLDEAHKGDKQESQRQHIYSILSRNGFLFNFSATFTDARDIYTTVSNFNLSEFVSHGYGKHISLLRSQVDAFREDALDYTNDQKQQIVLQSLIMTALVSEKLSAIRKIDSALYHKPLLVTLVNSVNTEDADLKLFFSELERLARGQIATTNFNAAKKELWASIKDGFDLMFESQPIGIDWTEFTALKLTDVREAIFNTSAKGAIEVLIRPSDRKEIAFKLQAADKPFALIRIGDVSDWIKETLSGYVINQAFSDEGFFETLNDDDSDIRILMGSRSFYEGWDSNRPNVITFINIGTQADAKKFVLQSIGRGVRVEPVKGKKRRIVNLKTAGLLPDPSIVDRVRNSAELLETLFIFGTNRTAIETVVRELKAEKNTHSETIALERNPDVNLSPLLVPKYKLATERMFQDEKRRVQEIRPEEFRMLSDYLKFVESDPVLLLRHRTSPKSLAEIREAVRLHAKHFRKTDEAVAYGNIDLLINNVARYMRIVPHNFDRLSELDDEIEHYKKIFVEMTDISHVEELKKKIEQVAKFKDIKTSKAELRSLRDQKKISEDEYDERLIELGRSTSDKEDYFYMGNALTIQRIARHYYIPTIISQNEKVTFIKNIIKVPSERNFIQNLGRYMADAENKLGEFGDWAFSKIVEGVDDIYIPYIDRYKNKTANFRPDFIFWFKREKSYDIVFVDPKGTEHRGSYTHKVDGYKEVFLGDDRKPRNLRYADLDVRVWLFLYNLDAQLLSDDIWVNDFGKIVDALLA